MKKEKLKVTTLGHVWSARELEDNIILIRAMRSAYTKKEIADRFEIDQSIVSDVLSNRTCKYLN